MRRRTHPSGQCCIDVFGLIEKVSKNVITREAFSSNLTQKQRVYKAPRSFTFYIHFKTWLICELFPLLKTTVLACPLRHLHLLKMVNRFDFKHLLTVYIFSLASSPHLQCWSGLLWQYARSFRTGAKPPLFQLTRMWYRVYSAFLV